MFVFFISQRSVWIALVPLLTNVRTHHARPHRLRHFRFKHPEAFRQRHFMQGTFIAGPARSVFWTPHRERSRRAPAEGVLDAVNYFHHAFASLVNHFTITACYPGRQHTRKKKQKHKQNRFMIFS